MRAALTCRKWRLAAAAQQETVTRITDLDAAIMDYIPVLAGEVVHHHQLGAIVAPMQLDGHGDDASVEGQRRTDAEEAGREVAEGEGARGSILMLMLVLASLAAGDGVWRAAGAAASVAASAAFCSAVIRAVNSVRKAAMTVAVAMCSRSMARRKEVRRRRLVHTPQYNARSSSRSERPSRLGILSMPYSSCWAAGACKNYCTAASAWSWSAERTCWVAVVVRLLGGSSGRRSEMSTLRVVLPLLSYANV